MQSQKRPSKFDYFKHDGLWCRAVTLGDREFIVPKNINAIPNGWQIRLIRVGYKPFSKAFMYRKGLRGATAALRDATAELKRQYRRGHLNQDQLPKRFVTLYQTRSVNPLLGVSVGVNTPKATAKENSPFVRINSRLGSTSQSRMLGRNFVTSIFNMTEDTFNSQVRYAVIERKLMEQCLETGKPFKKTAINHLSLLEKSILLDGIDLTQYNFSEMLHTYASTLGVDVYDYLSNKNIHHVHSKAGIYVSIPGSKSTKVFLFRKFKNPTDVFLLTSLYGRFCVRCENQPTENLDSNVVSEQIGVGEE